jgi:anti-sigma regulatory factor (Ser/Thr protein kinase)
VINGSQLNLGVTDSSCVGEIRRAAKQLAESSGFDETHVGRISIVATEIAANIVKHAANGTVLLQIFDDGSQPEFEILGIDRGAGMVDVERCLRDGYSTGGTAGTGLGAMSRLSETFDVSSTVGKGTVVLSRIRMRSAHQRDRPKPGFELGAINVALAGELECGDAWRAVQDGSSMAVLVADGLGHGSLAAVASRASAGAFLADPFAPPASNMTRLHAALSGTRGAAAACLVLRAADGKAEYAGVGNISGSIASRERSRGMVSHNGTLGMQLLRSQQFEYEWPLGSLAIMHSDGLSARWNLSDYPGLFTRHPAVVAGVLYRDHARSRDDATIVVARYLQ